MCCVESSALKLKSKLWANVRLRSCKQWRYEVDLFALKSDFCVICFILIYILLYYSIMTINVVPFLDK